MIPIYTVSMKASTGVQLSRILFSILIGFAGLNFVIRGFTAKYLFNETEWPTVVEDLPKYEARFGGRVVAVAFGLGLIILVSGCSPEAECRRVTQTTWQVWLLAQLTCPSSVGWIIRHSPPWSLLPSFHLAT